jgi:hypothetical protein
LTNVRNNEIKIKEILKVLQEDMIELGVALKNVSEEVREMQQTYPKAMHVVSHLAAKLVLTQEYLISSSNMWRKNKLNEKLLRVFNITLPCQNLCPLELGQPTECILDEQTQILTLKFSVRNINPEATVLKADSFRLIDRPKNGTKLCNTVYSGPKLIIHDKPTSCFIPIDSNSEFNSDIILEPTQGQCKPGSNNNLTAKFWIEENCVEKHVINENDILQIKYTGYFNYIYCNSLQIQLYGRLTDCPPFVFQLPASVSFQIGERKYISGDVQLTGNLEFIPTLSDELNFKMMPELHSLGTEKHAIEIKEKIDSIETKNNLEIIKESNKFYINGIFLIITGAIVAIVCMKYLKFKFRKKKIERNKSVKFRKSQNKTNEDLNELMSESEDEEKISTRPKSQMRVSKADPNNIIIASVVMLLFSQVNSNEIESMHITLTYDSPCKHISLGTQDLIWCENQFIRSFLEPIKSFCNGTLIQSININQSILDRISMNRRKRNIAYNKNFRLTRRKLLTQKAYDMKIKKMIETLIKLVSEYINEKFGLKLNRIKRNEKSEIGNKTQNILNGLITKFLISEQIIKKIGINWKNKRIDDNLISIVKLDQKYGKYLNTFEPFSCNLDITCRKIELELRKTVDGIFGISYLHNFKIIIFLLFLFSISFLAFIFVTIHKICSSNPINYKPIRRVQASYDLRNFPPPLPQSTN